MDKAMKVFIAQIISRGGAIQKELTDEESQLLVALRDSGMMEKDVTSRSVVEPTLELYLAAVACGVVTVTYSIKVDNGVPALVDERVSGAVFAGGVPLGMLWHSIGLLLADGQLVLGCVARNVYQVVEA